MGAPRVGDLTGHTYGRLTVLHLEAALERATTGDPMPL
jgi:hypothetical protein